MDTTGSTHAVSARLSDLLAKPLTDCTGDEIQETIELLEGQKEAIEQSQHASARAATFTAARHPARIAMNYVAVSISHDGGSVDEFSDYFAAMAEVDDTAKGANITGAQGVLAHLARFAAILMVEDAGGSRQLALSQAMEAADSYPVFDGDDYPVINK